MKHTEETKRKIALAHFGMKHSEETKKKISLNRKGKNLGSQNGKGNPPNKTSFKKGFIPWNKGLKGVMKAWNKGKPRTEIEKKNISNSLKGRLVWNKDKKCPQYGGANNWRWKGGITSKNQKIRDSLEYKLWRKSVFVRDNYQCVWGGKEHGNKLNADHIKPFALFPELRFAIDNGRTLCIDCHKKTDTYLKCKL